MGFHYINNEQKIRIALSQRAYNVMQDDMSVFGINTTATFINNVMENYRDDSMASLSNYLEQIRNDLYKEIDDANVDKASKDTLIDHIFLIRKENTIQKLRELMKEKSYSKLYHINNNNIEYLKCDCNDEKFYKERPGLYIKCILEEYSRLPFIEREKIYRKKIFDKVSSACENNIAMKVTVYYRDERKVLNVYPYKIIPDSMNTQLYLACYTFEQGQTSKDKKDASFSMARIPDPILLKQKAFLSKEEQRKIEEDIERLSVNYLLGEESEIHVKLTAKGRKTYHNYIISRPTKDEALSSEDEYVFHCSENHAFNYFYSFGDNAEIISPDSLRNRMIESHKKALDMYATK